LRSLNLNPESNYKKYQIQDGGFKMAYQKINNFAKFYKLEMTP